MAGNIVISAGGGDGTITGPTSGNLNIYSTAAKQIQLNGFAIATGTAHINAQGNDFVVGTNTAGGENERLRIQANPASNPANFVISNSNVGIGTTTPSGTLDVEGGTAASGNGNPITLQAQAGAAGSSGGSVMIEPGGGSAQGGVAIVSPFPPANGGVAIGYQAQSYGHSGVAAGAYATANGTYSVGIGAGAKANGDYSTAIGNSVFAGDATTNGNYSIAMGAGNASGVFPKVTGNNSVGIFMGDQSGVNVPNDNTMAIIGGNVGVGTTAPQTALDVNGAVNLRKGYFESIGALGTLNSSASLPSFTNNLYTATLTGGCSCFVNIPTITGFPTGNNAWTVTFFVTGDVSSTFNVQYNNSAANVFWDSNSIGGPGGNNYSGFLVPPGHTDVFTCVLMNAGTVNVYCGVSAQY